MLNDYQTMLRGLMRDPAVSYRLKNALLASDGADPVDALNEAITLERLAHQRLDELRGAESRLRARGRLPACLECADPDSATPCADHAPFGNADPLEGSRWEGGEG